MSVIPISFWCATHRPLQPPEVKGGARYASVASIYEIGISEAARPIAVASLEWN